MTAKTFVNSCIFLFLFQLVSMDDVRIKKKNTYKDDGKSVLVFYFVLG